MKSKTSPVQILSQTLSNSSFSVWAGPCAIESESQFKTIYDFVLKKGASGVRGGIYKMRTDSQNFQGLQAKAIPLVKKFKSAYPQTPFISEITDPRQLEHFQEVDILQVGTRNMFNYELLKELGKSQKPVLLKRSFSARIEEWLKAADYIAREGNSNIILCERGIRTFETAYRNTLDLNAVAFLKKETSFPVFVDPSHGTGDHSLVSSLCQAAIATGADGLLIETHNDPLKALSDSQQALSFESFEALMKDIQKILPIFNRHLQ